MSISIHTIETGTFKLDGGAMFGVVPKRLWNKLNPADENNMCTWSMRCLLIRVDDRNILVDTGIGTKQDEKFLSHFEPKDINNLEQSLANLGLGKKDITDVFLTHLHFDHVGGAVSKIDDVYLPTFPNAIYWSNKTHYEWATNPNPKEKASFLKENILPLNEHNVLKFVDEKEGSEFIPGVTMHFVDGHTKSMIYLKIKVGSQTFVYCADLIPSSHHVSLPYIMSYDVNPMATLVEKEALLNDAVENGYVLIFEHDPIIEAATVVRNNRGRIVVDQEGKMNDFVN